MPVFWNVKLCARPHKHFCFWDYTPEKYNHKLDYNQKTNQSTMYLQL